MPEAMLGEPVAAFGLEQGSAMVLQGALESGLLPVDLTLHYQAIDGRQITAQVHVDSDPARPGLVGYTGKVEDVTSVPDIGVATVEHLKTKRTAKRALPSPVPAKPAETGAATASLEDDPAAAPVVPAVKVDSRPSNGKTPAEAVLIDEPVHAPAATRPQEHPRRQPARQPITPHSSSLGYRAELGRLAPAQEVLTLAGSESLRQGKTVTMHSAFGQPAALAVPLQLQDGAAQLLLEFSDDFPGRIWTEDERMLVQQVADQLTLALENARLFQETEQRNEELATLNSVIESASRSLDVHNMLQATLAQVLTTTGYDCGLVSLLDAQDNRLHLTVHIGLPEKLASRLTDKGFGGTLSELVYTRQQALGITDMRQGAPVDVSGLIREDLLSYQGAPLESKGRIMGTLCLFGNKPHAISASNLSLLQAVGQQVGVAVENASLFEQTQSALGEAAALYQAAAELNVAASSMEILATLRRYTVLGQKSTSQAGIFLFDKPWTSSAEPEWIFPLALWDSETTVQIAPADRFLLREWAGSLDILGPDAPTLIADLDTDPRLGPRARGMNPGWREHLDRCGVKSLIYTPLSVAGKWIGLIAGMFKQKIQFTEEHGRRLMALAGQASVAVENLRLLEETRHKANQLQTAAEIARDTSGTLAIDQLLGRAVEQIRERLITTTQPFTC